MKNLKLSLILICNLLFAISTIQAQAPEKINYQAVARNLAGAPLINQPISVKYEIRQGSPTGTVVFAETHSLTTSPFGLFTAEIGGGTPISGTFPGIAWGTSPFYLFVEVDGAAMGTTQLLSVPYALYAKESANGPAGLPGKNSLSFSIPYTGPACINGGTQVDAGLDDNNDGTLQPLEVDYTYIICNGINGTNGTNGINGTPGTNGIDGVSIDSTINNNNGTFSFYYSNGTSFTTSDLTGPAGTSGTTYFAGNGISLSGDTITNLGDLDNNPTNELQLLSISNDTIFLSNGGFAPLPSAGGFWTQLGGSIHNTNIGNVGIGTNTPLHQLSVVSNDSVVASFLGTNPSVAAIVVANFNPSASTGIVFFNGVDTTSYIFLNPTNNALIINNNIVSGNIILNTENAIVNQATTLANQIQNLIYNRTDTIFNQSPSGTIIHVNQGMFLTDSLYVLGNNAANTNWILANDGAGQAKWTDPSTIVGSVGDNWGSQTVVTDTSLFGDGAGTPLSVNPNIIPTQTSQLTNNSGFITSPNDADTSVTNELQTITKVGNVVTLSNGGGSFTDDVNDADFDPTNEIQNLSITGNNLNISGGGTGTAISSSVPALNQVLTWNGTAWVAQNAALGTDNQDLSLTGNTLSLTNDATPVDLTTYLDNTDAQTLSVTTSPSNVTLSITGGNAVNFAVDDSPTNEIQDLSSTTSPGTVTVDITGGISTTFSIDDADANPANELITSFAVNGTNLELIEAGNTWNVPLTSLSAAGKWSENAGNLYPTNLTNNVGIGTNSPIGKLEVAGGSIILRDATDVIDAIELAAGTGASASGSLVLKNSGTTTVNFSGIGTSWFNAGNVGIGTATPTNGKLDVQNTTNNVNTFSSIHTGTNAHAGYFQINNAANNLNAINATTNGAGAAINASNTYSGGNAIRDGIYVTVNGFGVAGTTNKAGYFSASNAASNYAAIFDQGDVGIGTTTPSAKLHVTGGQIFNNWTNPNNNNPNLMIINYNSVSGPGYNTGTLGQVTIATSDGAEAKLAIQGHAGGDGGNKYGIYGNATGLGTNNIAGYFSASGATNNYAIIVPSTGGNVGIGTTTPTAKLHIGGVAGTDGIRFPDGTLQTTAATGSSGWNLTGNAGTNATTNFIGTTDNVALNFRVNNTTAGKIDSLGRNSFFGFLAGANTSGVVNSNTAMGFQALYLNATGTQNTAMGVEALRNNTGSYNTATGYTALRENTNGTYNTAIGHSALATNTSGNNNTATGMSALFANTTGINNTANGQSALSSNTTGDNNTANGTGALGSNNIGNYNTAVGNTALYSNTTGNYNTAIGMFAGDGYLNGNQNTFLGYNSDASVDNLTNATAIGAGAIVSQSNSLILGSGANVGIGTSTPTAKLDVNGSVVISGANTNELNRAQTGAANLVPIAYGNISGNTTINATTGNFTVVWNGTNLWYEITITGEAYNNTNYIATITPIGGVQVTTATSTLGGKLLVVFNDLGGTKIQQAFQFLVYKP
jgi:hypothetical protein